MKTLSAPWQEKIPAAVQEIFATLHQEGHLAYLVGGAVRDLLWGKNPKDFDIVSSATPEQIEVLFPRTVPVGKQFGIMVVVIRDQAFEVATFRREGDYADSRHPDKIEFCGPEEDALRRDFTINALFWDPQKSQIIDYVDGLDDIKSKKLRTVGEAAKRFQEDSLRIVRALRFSAQFPELYMDPSLVTAAQDAAKNPDDQKRLASLSKERIQQELNLLLNGDASERALALWQKLDLQNIFGLAPLAPNFSHELNTIRILLNDTDFRNFFLPAEDLRSALFWLPFRFSLAVLKLPQKTQRLWRDSAELQKYCEPCFVYKILSLAEQKKFWAHPAAGLALAEWLVKKESDWPKIQSALKQALLWKESGRLHPKNILSSKDLISKKISAGPEMGKILKMAADAELMEEFSDRPGAMLWLDNYLKKK